MEKAGKASEEASEAAGRTSMAFGGALGRRGSWRELEEPWRELEAGKGRR